jgi:hypothetical protein
LLEIAQELAKAHGWGDYDAEIMDTKAPKVSSSRHRSRLPSRRSNLRDRAVPDGAHHAAAGIRVVQDTGQRLAH